MNSFLPIWLPRDSCIGVSLGHENVCSYSELLWLCQQDCQRKATNSLDRIHENDCASTICMMSMAVFQICGCTPWYT